MVSEKCLDVRVSPGVCVSDMDPREPVMTAKIIPIGSHIITLFCLPCGSSYGTMIYSVRELVEFRMGRMKSHDQFYILCNYFTLGRGLDLAGNHCILGVLSTLT